MNMNAKDKSNNLLRIIDEPFLKINLGSSSYYGCKLIRNKLLKKTIDTLPMERILSKCDCFDVSFLNGIRRPFFSVLLQTLVLVMKCLVKLKPQITKERICFE